MKIFSGSQTAVFLPGRGGGSVRCIVRIDLAIEDQKNWRTFSVEIYSILSISDIKIIFPLSVGLSVITCYPRSLLKLV